MRPLFLFVLLFSVSFSVSFSFSCSCSCSFSCSVSDLHRRLSSSSWWLPTGLSVGYHLVTSNDQVESRRVWWVAGGSSHTFVAESPDECARAVVGVTPQFGVFSLLSSLLSLFIFISLHIFSLLSSHF